MRRSAGQRLPEWWWSLRDDDKRLRRGGSRDWAAALVALLPVALLLAVMPAAAQPAGAPPAGSPPASPGDHVEVVITDVPAARERFHGVMSRQPGAVKVATLPDSGSEVWHVPKRLLAQAATALAALGCKVVELSPDGMRIEYRDIASLTLTPEQRAALARLARTPETVRVGAMSLPPPAVVEHAMAQSGATAASDWEPTGERRVRLTLPLPDGRRVGLVRRRPIVKTDAGLTWVGEVEETGERAVLMLARDGGLSGYFGYGGRIWSVDNAEGGIHTMAEIDPVMLPPDHSPAVGDRAALAARAAPMPPEPPVAPLTDADRRRLEAKETTIDLMLLFTRTSVGRYLAKPAQWSALAAATMNETFRNSGLANVSVRVVHHEVIDYDESGAEQFDHLYRMVDGTGPFARLKQLRDEKKADIVGLVLHSPSGCGLSTRVGAEADEAFFVVHHACAVITYSIPHEIGHILGARHDRRIDAAGTAFVYGHGHVNGAKWRTMMSYQASCGGCPRIPFWSNPRVLFNGEPTGTPASDNARVILEQAERVSRFR